MIPAGSARNPPADPGTGSPETPGGPESRRFGRGTRRIGLQFGTDSLA